MNEVQKLVACGLFALALYALTGGRLWARWPGWCMAGIVLVLLAMGGLAIGVHLAQGGR